jgi:alpha-tubulin suppressor-like RCC1 family protein/Ca2+-binding EF-hand superfamily protein
LKTCNSRFGIKGSLIGMGGTYSQLSYRRTDCQVIDEFQVLTSCWNHHHIRGLSARLKLISFNFCLSPSKFGELMELGNNEFFHDLVGKWFTLLRNNTKSKVVNGLEFLAALVICARQGKFNERISCIFDIFDFDETGKMTRDELMILLKSCIRGLAKITVGLAVRLAELCPISQLEEITDDAFRHADMDTSGEINKDEFMRWASDSPKVANLVKHFVPPEPMTEGGAAELMQRQWRRRQAYSELQRRKKLMKRLDEEEMGDATKLIQSAVRGRKTRRQQMHLKKIERNAHNGAIFTFGANPRGSLGHGRPDGKDSTSGGDEASVVLEPRLIEYFKDAEYRCVSVATGSMHSCAVTSDGSAHTWGAGVPGALGHLRANEVLEHVEHSPCRADDLDGVAIVASAVGNRHTIAVSSEGDAYVWGSGEFGQLGLGDVDDVESELYKQAYDTHTGKTYPFVDLPLKIDLPIFHDVRIVSVACGYYFTIAVDADGMVYSWGEGSEGQLGLGYSSEFQVGFLDEYIQRSNFTYMPSPVHVEALEEIPIRSVAVGGNHVYAIARDHSVYEWGYWGKRLGTETESLFEPQHVEELEGLWVHSIAAGTEHTLALCGSLRLSVRGMTPVRRVPDPRAPGGYTTVEVEDEEGDASMYSLRANFGLTVDDVAENPQRGELMFVQIQEEDEDEDDIDEDGGARSGAGARGDLAPPGGHSTINSDSAFAGAAVQRVSSYSHRYNSYMELLRDRFSSRGVNGKTVLIDRGPAPGVWVSVPSNKAGDFSGEHVEMFALAAKFGPTITKAGLSADSFYPPEKISNLKYYIRPDQIPGRVVLIDFGDDDLALDTHDTDPDALIQNLMAALLRRVRDAEKCRAAAVIIIFDFHDAEPFALEDTESVGGANEVRIPALMISKADGDRLKSCLDETGRAPLRLFRRTDSMMQKVIAAQDAGAEAIIVMQNEKIGAATQLQDEGGEMRIVEDVANTINSASARSRSRPGGAGDAGVVDGTSVVTKLVVMISYPDGERIKQHLKKVQSTLESSSYALDKHTLICAHRRAVICSPNRPSISSPFHLLALPFTFALSLSDAQLYERFLSDGNRLLGDGRCICVGLWGGWPPWSGGHGQRCDLRVWLRYECRPLVPVCWRTRVGFRPGGPYGHAGRCGRRALCMCKCCAEC